MDITWHDISEFQPKAMNMVLVRMQSFSNRKRKAYKSRVYLCICLRGFSQHLFVYPQPEFGDGMLGFELVDGVWKWTGVHRSGRVYEATHFALINEPEA